MAKHRKQESGTATKVAVASALAVGAVAGGPAVANAAPVTIPGTAITVDVPGVEAIPGIEAVPGVEQWIPSLSSQAAMGNYNAAISSLSSAPLAEVGNQIVAVAQSKLGAPYMSGAAGPSAFDCSGFTSWVYAQVGKAIPRTSQAQVSAGTPVAYNDLQPGDIVAFYGGASHVAIYAGNGQIIDALNSSAPVGVRPLSMMPFHSAVRY